MAPKAKMKAKAAPKAKGAAKAKPRARHGALRRVGADMRRPAAAEERAPRASVEDQWKAGREVAAGDLHPLALEEETYIIVTQGHLYYLNDCKIAGKVQGIEVPGSCRSKGDTSPQTPLHVHLSRRLCGVLHWMRLHETVQCLHSRENCFEVFAFHRFDI